MSMTTIVAATAGMVGLSSLLGAVLYTMAKKTQGDGSDEKIELLTNLLPGNNCGACGMAGCAAMAEALARGEAVPQNCPVATIAQIEALSQALGLSNGNVNRTRRVARVRCGGTRGLAPRRADYEGVLDCRAADLVGKGTKACVFGCLGLGTCARVCPFGAITMGEDGLPHVNENLCTGCALCEAACPRGVIAVFDASQEIFVRCVSTAPGKQVRSVCEVGCIGCGICVRVCEEGAVEMLGHLAVVDPDRCTACGKCVEKCPTDAMRNILVDAGVAVGVAS